MESIHSTTEKFIVIGEAHQRLPEKARCAVRLSAHEHQLLRSAFHEAGHAVIGLELGFDLIAKIEPITIFHEPINIRAENVERIKLHAVEMSLGLKTDVFETRVRWQDYALDSLRTVERLAAEIGIAGRLHLWPDKSLGSAGVTKHMSDPDEHYRWLNKWWTRISE